MITAFLFLSSFIQFYWLYRLLKKSDEYNARLTILERREPEKRVHAPVVPVREWEKPIDNFTPKKPETLRPNQVRGREVEENVYEFDSKL